MDTLNLVKGERGSPGFFRAGGHHSLTAQAGIGTYLKLVPSQLSFEE
jgi:hypothetical protein